MSCVCVVPHMLIWWRCGRTDWKTGKWREMQNSIHWHQIRVRNSGENEKHSMTYVAMYVMCLLNCFLCVVLKELFIVFLWSPCLLHDTCESLCEMNLSCFICTVLCWTSLFSIVCWYVHWSCWKRLCDLLKLINTWQDRDGGKEEKRETNYNWNWFFIKMTSFIIVHPNNLFYESKQYHNHNSFWSFAPLFTVQNLRTVMYDVFYWSDYDWLCPILDIALHRWCFCQQQVYNVFLKWPILNGYYSLVGWNELWHCKAFIRCFL